MIKITTAKSIKIFLFFKKNSNSSFDDEKKNKFANLLRVFEYFNIYLFAFNNIIKIYRFEKIKMKSSNKEIKIKKSAVESMNNRKTKTFIIFLDEIFFFLISTGDFDWINFFDITKLNNNSFSKFNFFLRVSKQKKL